MARVSLFLFSTVLISLIAVSFASGDKHHRPLRSKFADENPIRKVTVDSLRELEASFIEAVGYNRHVLSFANFALRYGKKYRAAEEIKKRFEIFMDNLKKIESHNKKGLSYTLGINAFSDMTWEEFHDQRLAAPQYCSATNKSSIEFTNLPLPESKDWRDAGIVSPVKDQGDCGSCWTFSTTGALEAAYTQAHGKSISLSEQQLLDCAGAYNNNGCNGGLPSQAFEYIKDNGGLETEESYPYEAKEGPCRFSPENVAVKVHNSINITEGNEEQLKAAVALIRPVSVAFEVLPDFKQYQGGIYSSDECGSTPLDVNHAVLAVGYGVEKGVPYWIVKNSWGADWGLDGYFMMEMGKNMCGVATCASFPIVE